MAAPPYAVKPAKQLGPDGGEEQIHKIRITLTSKNVKNIEKGTSKILYFLLLFFCYGFLVLICVDPCNKNDD